MVVFYDEPEQAKLDMGEIYRQNYMDARDLVNDLTINNNKLLNEIETLKTLLSIAENHIPDSEFNWYQLERRAFETKRIADNF